MKKKKRTKSELINLLSIKKSKVESTLDKTKKEAQRLENRIYKREAEGLSAKFLKKILSEKRKAARSIRHKLKSINQELDTLRKSPGIDGFFFIIENTRKKIIMTKTLKIIHIIG